MSKQSIVDQEARDAFCADLEHNYSVIAPAGSGKTRAIVSRIMEMATLPVEQAIEVLPRLVVVTYTNKAAGEMLMRVRREMSALNLRQEVTSSLNRAFFGTIHSFCLRLVRQHGHHLGIRGNLSPSGDSRELWDAFVNQFYDMEGIDQARWERLSRYVKLEDLLKVAREISPSLDHGGETLVPPIDGSSLLAVPPKKGSAAGMVERGQQLFRHWQVQEKEGAPYNPIPEWTKGGKEFQSAWHEAFSPLRAWIANETRALGIQIARKYRDFRLQRGYMTYADQISLALDLFSVPEAAVAIREQRHVLILDEAQDTDPVQFEVLLETVRPKDAKGYWLRGAKDAPRDGAFCMVGDPQQSIYGDRADLFYYEKVRSQLEESGAREVKFQVTFRCDSNVISFVNSQGRQLLNGMEGQAQYVPLTSRGDALPGQVAGVRMTLPEGEGELSTRKAYRHEAAILAQWIKKIGVEGFRARCWGEVAVLCPRKDWLLDVAKALHKVKMKTQLQSNDQVMGGSPYVRWFVASAKVIGEPRNHFEIVGALRDVFGISDQDLHQFCKGDGSKFQIESPTRGNGAVEQGLALLCKVRDQVRSLPLRDGMHEMVRLLSLRERLGLLKEDFDEGGEEDIDWLLSLASSVEASGTTYAGWIKMLEDLLEEGRPDDQPDSDAIQLITCQKSKGLEWDAVIVPFLSRGIRFRSPEYPRVQRKEGSHDSFLIWTKEEGEYLKERKFQELQRLLYVTLTRARHSLVLVDDSVLMERGSNSWAHIFFGKEGDFDLKLNDPVPLAKAEVKDDPSPEIPTVPPVEKKDWEKAAVAAMNFIGRVLPHSLSHQSNPEEPEVRAEAVAVGFENERQVALEYGTWWHGMCERMSWSAGRDEWALEFERSLFDSPDRERAREEWAGFLNSELARLFEDGHFIFHSEMPILAPLDGKSWIEGIIDLAIYDPSKRQWLIVDWKTDSASSKGEQALVEGYSPQLNAYVDSLEKMSGISARAAIFSTPRGKLFWVKKNDEK